MVGSAISSPPMTLFDQDRRPADKCQGSSTTPRALGATATQNDNARDRARRGNSVTTVSPHAENSESSSHPKVQSISANTNFAASADQLRPLVLASKSNYQCIVDGTNSQFGLHYPDHLVKGVISKRKSHSAAERGRRDRMKNALQRMSELLPQKGHVSGEDDEIPIGNSAGEATNDTDARQGSVGSQATCKASIVEMAIDYIQSLQKEVLELNSKLDEQGASIRAVMITLRLHRIKVEGHHLQMAPCRKENQASSTKEDKNGYGIG